MFLVSVNYRSFSFAHASSCNTFVSAYTVHKFKDHTNNRIDLIDLMNITEIFLIISVKKKKN